MSDKKRFFLIVNPVSGTNDKSKIVPKIVKALNSIGFDVTVEYTKAKGDASTLAIKAANQHYDAIGACGGDGTVNETARALCGTGVPLAIIPSGSGNGLARHIGVPVDEMASIEIIKQNHIIDSDYGEVCGQKFFTTFGMGFDAEVAHDFANQGKRGLYTYIKSCLRVFKWHKGNNYTIQIDDNPAIEKHAFLITCCNASQFGNDTFIAPHASIKDGILDVVILESAPTLTTLLTGFLMMEGWIHRSPQAKTIKAKHVVIDREAVGHAHIDGEPVDMPAHLDIKCIPGALRLYTNANKSRIVPFITPIKNTFRVMSIRIKNMVRPGG